MSRYLFSLPSFACILVGLQKLFFSSSCHAFSVSPENFLMFGFSILACCRSLFICDSSLCSHQGFNFLSVVFKGTPIFPQTNFAPAYIKSLVGIFVNKSFTFSVSDSTVLQSWFLREGNVVFISDMILLMVSLLVFSSWVSVCICVFAVHGLLSCRVWLGVFGFSVCIVSVSMVGVS